MLPRQEGMRPMSESGSENGKSLSDTKPDKWFDRIYAEQDFARNIAIGAGAGAGLLMFLYWQHWLPTVLAIAMTFSIVKLLADPWKEARERKHKRRQLRELFNNLGHEEWDVVKAFVLHGGSVMTWGECNASERVSRAGIESLLNRGLIEMSTTADATTETFVLDTGLFDYAREVMFEDLFE